LFRTFRRWPLRQTRYPTPQQRDRRRRRQSKHLFLTPARQATTTKTTGESNQDATIKKMNEDEKQKVDTKGK
jgi:hypothetical protein